MQILTTIAELRARLEAERAVGRRVGFVPTMGYLHDGHASLMRAAREVCDHVTATIFVNPLQFGANEDLSTYPRDLEGDLEVAREAGVDLVFAPSVDEMYPGGTPPLTTVSVAALGERWEGAIRPGHFDGVATVVTKLFAIAGPCHAFFGEKDYQQLQIVRRMAADLNLAVDVVGCPIVRERDGLAMSSRNVYLSDEERIAARALNRALAAAVDVVSDGERDPARVTGAMTSPVSSEPAAELHYAAVVDPATLEPVTGPLEPGEYRLLIAAQVGRPRLIDNCALRVS